MGIQKYIPKKKNIIDRRTPDGGYYEAVCDDCGTVFYPKRSNARYCSHSCTVAAMRKRNLENPPEKKKEPAMQMDQGGVVLIGSGKEVANYFKKYRLAAYVKILMSDDFEIGTNCSPIYENDKDEKHQVLHDYNLYRISSRVWKLMKD